MSTPAKHTLVFVTDELVVQRLYENVARHSYCDAHFNAILETCPLDDDEMVVPAQPGEMCEECP